jgi:diacylglycerol kinase (ATP)
MPSQDRERPDTTPFRRALVIGNPIAGRGRAERAASEIVVGLERRGLDVELHTTRCRGDAIERVLGRHPGVDLIVSIGGDGTLREVFEGVGGDDVPVAVLPLGTANVLSLDLGLPRDPQGTLRMIERGATTRLDVAVANGKTSFLVTGVGLDAAAVAEVERLRRGPISKASYVAAMLRTLRTYRAPRLSVELDGAVLDEPVGAVLISNVIHYGGVFRLSRERRLDDGRFEVYLFRDGRTVAMGVAALRAFAGRLPGGTCRMECARRVRVTSRDPVPYHVDGDAGGELPLEFEVSPVQRRILVPRPVGGRGTCSHDPRPTPERPR